METFLILLLALAGLGVFFVWQPGGTVIASNAALVDDLGPGRLSGETIALANASRFDSTYYKEPLTEYTVGGWDQDPLQQLIDELMPAIEVPDRFTYKASSHADYFSRFEGDEDIRAMGGQFGRIDTARMTDVDGRLDEKGLVISVDKRDIEEDPMAREKAIDRVRRILLRTELRRVVALIVAASVNTDKTWDAESDPDMDVSDELRDVADDVGIRPTRCIYGSAAWAIRAKAFRAQNNAGGYASAAWTQQQVGDFVGVNAISVTESRYRSSSSALTTLFGSLVLMYQADAGMTKDDPSNVKRFVGNVAGQRQAVYEQDFPRHVEITVAHKSLPKLTSTLGMRRFTVSAS